MVDDDGRTDDGRMPDHGHPISSPCEPNGSGELKSNINKLHFFIGIDNYSKIWSVSVVPFSCITSQSMVVQGFIPTTILGLLLK